MGIAERNCVGGLAAEMSINCLKGSWRASAPFLVQTSHQILPSPRRGARLLTQAVQLAVWPKSQHELRKGAQQEAPSARTMSRAAVKQHPRCARRIANFSSPQTRSRRVKSNHETISRRGNSHAHTPKWLAMAKSRIFILVGEQPFIYSSRPSNLPPPPAHPPPQTPICGASTQMKRLPEPTTLL